MIGCAVGQDWACGIDTMIAPAALVVAALTGVVVGRFVPYRVTDNNWFRLASPIVAVTLGLAGYVYGAHTMATVHLPWDACI